MITTDQAQHYLFEIVREADIVEDCYQRFQRAAETWLKDHYSTTGDSPRSWEGTVAERDMLAALEGILSAYARISLFFFPEPRSKRFGLERAAVLRDMVGIDVSHPVGNRALRNDWMHLDERIDREVRAKGSVPVGYFFQLPHLLSADFVAQTFRLIDPGSETVFILGRAYHLAALVGAVQHINQQAVLALFPS